MNDETFARAIRRAFSRYEMSNAATFPGGYSTQAGGATRRRGWLPRVAVPIVAVAAGAAVLASTVLAPQQAFASWSATPSGANPTVVAGASDECTTADPDHLGGLRLVGSEQRGEYTMLLFGDGGAYGLCLTGPDIDPMILAGPGTNAVDAPGASPEHEGASGQPAPGVTFIAQPGADAPIADRVQAWVVGVTPDVARVVIERDGSEPTVATLGDEVAFAWWPAGTEAVAVIAF
ncbi:MAG TPA: hypothetical protein VGP30_07095, partial [Candidatus Limnocylindrales bacterium]|nr:hypothetical protein [Candidatus Limnocylindrales bacterium]